MVLIKWSVLCRLLKRFTSTTLTAWSLRTPQWRLSSRVVRGRTTWWRRVQRPWESGSTLSSQERRAIRSSLTALSALDSSQVTSCLLVTLPSRVLLHKIVWEGGEFLRKNSLDESALAILCTVLRFCVSNNIILQFSLCKTVKTNISKHLMLSLQDKNYFLFHFWRSCVQQNNSKKRNFLKIRIFYKITTYVYFVNIKSFLLYTVYNCNVC